MVDGFGSLAPMPDGVSREGREGRKDGVILPGVSDLGAVHFVKDTAPPLSESPFQGEVRLQGRVELETPGRRHHPIIPREGAKKKGSREEIGRDVRAETRGRRDAGASPASREAPGPLLRVSSSPRDSITAAAPRQGRWRRGLGDAKDFAPFAPSRDPFAFRHGSAPAGFVGALTLWHRGNSLFPTFCPPIDTEALRCHKNGSATIAAKSSIWKKRLGGLSA